MAMILARLTLIYRLGVGIPIITIYSNVIEILRFERFYARYSHLTSNVFDLVDAVIFTCQDHPNRQRKDRPNRGPQIEKALRIHN